MILSEQPRIELLNMDCMEFMAGCKDKQFSLAIVDPPYGLGSRLSDGGGKLKDRPFRVLYKESSQWDSAPSVDYFTSLKRISRNQIICGGNYFLEHLGSTRGFIIWDKKQALTTLSECEFIWTSFDCPAKMFKKTSTDLNRFHPTQKPVKLYEWLLTNYAKPGDTILDPHGGSFSSAIAAYRLGFDYTGIELDADYFNAAVKRFKEQTAQMDIFRQVDKLEPKQLTIE